MSKGSKRRPMQISQEEYAQRWRDAFGGWDAYNKSCEADVVFLDRLMNKKPRLPTSDRKGKMTAQEVPPSSPCA